MEIPPVTISPLKGMRFIYYEELKNPENAMITEAVFKLMNETGTTGSKVALINGWTDGTKIEP